MEKKNVPQRIKDIAKELEELSKEVYRARYDHEDNSSKMLSQELSDELFQIQSKLAYQCYWKAEELFE